jgi:diguanylate cyclase
MEQPKAPAEIAREAIRKLSSRRLPPTPDNFRQAYAEVSGVAAAPDSSAEEKRDPRWPDVLRPLIKQWDTHQTGLTQARKREMLERVLINFGNDSPALHQKLDALARTWAAGARDEDEPDPAVPVQEAASKSNPDEGAGGLPPDSPDAGG